LFRVPHVKPKAKPKSKDGDKKPGQGRNITR
jgi:hypothetical protein